MSLKIAIQGIETSFHDVAARKYFGNDIKVVECNSFKLLCDSLRDGTSDYAVMAIENSIAGSLLANYALLQDYHFNIAGEVFLNIQMHLMAMPGVNLEDIKVIESHPIAIRQCANFLNQNTEKEVLEKRDTAECAKIISEDRLMDTAAIANTAAAKKFGLNILESRIETNKQNFTRFFILSRGVEDKKNTNSKTQLKFNSINKSSIYFELKGSTGSLADVLVVFKENKINLTKIQSVPIIGKPYQYGFYVDLEWDDKENYLNSIKNLKSKGDNHIEIYLFGHYIKATYKIDE